MAIQSNTNRIDYKPGSGVKTFPFSFPVYTKSDLKVYTVDSSHTIVQRTLDGAGAFDYQQTDANIPGGVAGGSVTLNTAPDNFSQVILIRVVPFTQASSYDNFKGVDGKLGYEKVYDLLCMQIQQLQEQLNRVLKFDITTQNPPVLLPSISDSNNFGGFLQFAADGSSIIVGAGEGGTINITYSTGAFAHRVVQASGDSTWLVPANVNRIKVQMYGSGGGGGGGGDLNGGGHFGGRGEFGAPGGYVTATLNVTPGQTLYTRISGGGGAGGAAGAGGDGSPGANGGDTILADHADFSTGLWLKAKGGKGGQGGLFGVATLVTPGNWHEAPAIPGGSENQGWTPDYTIVGGGSSGEGGGAGGTGAGGTPAAGGQGGMGRLVIWY